ncbi:MAG TPA: VOC family protein [Anaerolineales bacterium]|nr:VOC family protein [Anaerolineales bacterium]
MSLPHQTTVGAVALTVSDLERSLAYYQNNLGLALQRRENGTAWLGAWQSDAKHRPFLILTEQPGARHPGRATGLYHFAILTPSRLALAKTLRQLAETKTPVSGFADHGVSEAIYLSDPDENGIEIYRDRPRGEWPFENGKLQMVSDPLDLEGILSELQGKDEPWTGLHPDTVLGHMHIHVANLPEAVQFYRDVVGFDLMQYFGNSAGFLSAGGYHHHLGVNTWNGVGAHPPPPGSVGLRWYTIILPNQEELDRVADRLKTSGTPIEERAEGLFFRDPSQNGVILTA